MNNNFINKTKNFILSYSNKVFIIPAAFMSLVLCMAYNSLKDINTTSFDRTIGQAMMNVIDVSKRISNFQFYLFILIPITFLITYIVVCILCYQKDDRNKDSIKFLNMISIVSFLQLIIAYFNKFTDVNKNIFSIGITLPACISAIILLYLIINRAYTAIFNFKILKWCIFATFPIFFASTLFVYKMKIQYNSMYSAIIYSGILLVFYLLVSIFQHLSNNWINLGKLQLAYIPMMIAPSAVSIFLETTNILNQYNIFINSKLRYTLLIYLVSLTLTFFIYLYLKMRKSVSSEFSMEKFYYPLLILAATLIYAQIPMQTTIVTDLFESSNHGVAISELFNHGKLPIIENFDAHMLSLQIWGIIYGFINMDFLGATFVPYFPYENVLFFILFYFLLKNYFDEDIAVLITLFYPLLLDGNVNYFNFPIVNLYYFGFLIILTFIKSYKKPSFKTYVLFWLSIAITCLYRLDTGFTFALAASITWVQVYLLDKNSIKLRKLLISFAFVVTACLGIFSSLCIIKNINLEDRIIEILKLSGSNTNWSYDTIGNPNTVAFSLHYIFVPVTVVALFAIILFKILKDKNFIPKTKFIILSNLAFAYIFNMSRGLVRHSLAEGVTQIIVFTAPLFISMSLSELNRKHRLITFVGSYFSIMLLLFISVNPVNKTSESLANLSINKHLNFEQYNTIETKKVQRINLNKDLEESIKPTIQVINSLLKLNETYLDFSNSGLLYPLTKKESPVYVNQSPGLLSGEKTQQLYINEIEKNWDKVDFVLMPTENYSISAILDGVQNSYRYYLVSEYISIHYKPLIKTGIYAIWCKTDQYNERKQLVDEMLSNNFFFENNVTKDTQNNNTIDVINTQTDNNTPIQIEKIGYFYGNNQVLHNYALKEIPYTWAKYDKNSIASKEVLLNLDNNFSLAKAQEKILDFPISKIDKQSGNYICITASSLTDSTMTLELGEKIDKDFKPFSTFTFNLKAGENINYLIRVSSDFLWYLDTVNSIKLTSDTSLKNVSASILKGDTLD